MTETVRTEAELLAIFEDGPIKITKENVRDLIVSVAYEIELAALSPAEYALGFIEASAALTPILDGTFVDINESLAPGLVSDEFAIAPGEITYIGTTDKIFAVDLSVTAEKTGVGHERYTYAVAVNDVPLAPFASDSVDNKIDSMSIIGIIALSTNDTIKVQVRGDGTTEALNVQDLNLRLLEIPQ